MIELRPYQSRTIEKLWAWFRRNPTGHPIVEVAVGGGKSILSPRPSAKPSNIPARAS
jgi:superfamily II DNA or RNA helicase